MTTVSIGQTIASELNSHQWLWIQLLIHYIQLQSTRAIKAAPVGDIQRLGISIIKYALIEAPFIFFFPFNVCCSVIELWRVGSSIEKAQLKLMKSFRLSRGGKVISCCAASSSSVTNDTVKNKVCRRKDARAPRSWTARSLQTPGSNRISISNPSGPRREPMGFLLINIFDHFNENWWSSTLFERLWLQVYLVLCQ